MIHVKYKYQMSGKLIALENKILANFAMVVFVGFDGFQM